MKVDGISLLVIYSKKSCVLLPAYYRGCCRYFRPCIRADPLSCAPWGSRKKNHLPVHDVAFCLALLCPDSSLVARSCRYVCLQDPFMVCAVVYLCYVLFKVFRAGGGRGVLRADTAVMFALWI